MSDINDLLKAKEEEIEKLNKMKDALRIQLSKAKEEITQLKAGGAGVAAAPTNGADSELLKLKDEEIEKLNKMKDALKIQLGKAKEEIAQLKANGAGATAIPTSGSDSELSKLKDEEIEKLNKMKDALRSQLGKAKEEIAQLKASGTGTAVAPTSGADPELIKTKDQEIEKLTNSNNQVMGENAKLNMEIGDLQDQVSDLKNQLDAAKKTPAQVATTPQAGEPGKEGEPNLSVDQLLQQVKNGMFKLGSQNHSIEQKVDDILEKLENLGPVPTVSATTSHPMKETVNKMAKFDGGPKTPAIDGYKSPALEQLKNEEPEMSARRGLKAPAVMMGMGDDSTKAPEPDVFTRKPSDLQRGVERQAPQRAFSLKPVAKSEEDEPQPSKPSTIGGGAGGIQTIPYPGDGVLKCPNCGEQNFKEMENRAKVISFVPTKKYGKKYYCKQCRSEWDYELS